MIDRVICRIIGHKPLGVDVTGQKYYECCRCEARKHLDERGWS